MHSTHRLSILATLLITILLSASSPVAAAEGAPRLDATSHPINLMVDRLITLLGDVGCIVDPSGQCDDVAEGNTFGDSLDVGCIVDPDGGPCRDNG